MISRFLLAATTALLLTACAKDAAKPDAAEAGADTAAIELHFHAIAGLNPGANGQPAPVRVRFFELKNAATFSRSDYFALADRAQSTLGLDLLDQDEIMVQPGQQLTIQRDLDPATRQVGLLVGYRELDRAQWRAVLSVAPRQYTEYQISLDVRAVSADVVAPSSSPAQ
ncbi:type VI secretion system lipoprotein TssJ [Pseudomonas sp. CCM 7891]|uniref:Type VI secretion system lipoprotein TssJ n=1 Tax=Pseudomonas karstica TaxID=1055468 RepID=A0A7X2RR02_9PSED|nr:type VI secretion system lipoprotein TssJ [Pseudomonas karstica]MTD17600.1 type VI secretion system lipoprotein TssJ [Pseudomonas karstica]